MSEQVGLYRVITWWRLEFLEASWLAVSRLVGGDLVGGEMVCWRDDRKPI